MAQKLGQLKEYIKYIQTKVGHSKNYFSNEYADLYCFFYADQGINALILTETFRINFR